MIYKGKIAFWYVAIIFIYNVIPLFFLQKSLLLFSILLAYYLIGNLIMIPSLIRNRVEMKSDRFIFCFGFSTKEYLYNNIKSITFTNDLTAGGACSLDRLYIDLKDQETILSLQDNEKFVKGLLLKNENIEVIHQEGI